MTASIPPCLLSHCARGTTALTQQTAERLRYTLYYINRIYYITPFPVSQGDFLRSFVLTDFRFSCGTRPPRGMCRLRFPRSTQQAAGRPRSRNDEITLAIRQNLRYTEHTGRRSIKAGRRVPLPPYAPMQDERTVPHSRITAPKPSLPVFLGCCKGRITGVCSFTRCRDLFVPRRSCCLGRIARREILWRS